MRAKPILCQMPQQVISPQRAVFPQQDFQRTATHRRQFQLVHGTMAFGGCDRGVDTGGVIVAVKTDGRHKGNLRRFVG